MLVTVIWVSVHVSVNGVVVDLLSVHGTDDADVMAIDPILGNWLEMNCPDFRSVRIHGDRGIWVRSSCP